MTSLSSAGDVSGGMSGDVVVLKGAVVVTRELNRKAPERTNNWSSLT